MGLAEGPVVDGGLPHEDGDVQAQRRGEGLESVMCLLIWNFPPQSVPSLSLMTRHDQSLCSRQGGTGKPFRATQHPELE